MSNVSGTSSNRNDQWQTLERDEDANKTLNDARKDAGYTEETHLHGKDKTYGETKAGQQSPYHSIGEAALHLAPDVSAHVIEHSVGGIIGACALPVAGGIGLYLGARMIKESHDKGTERKEALTRDATRGGMLLSLDIPSGYKAAELAKTPEATKNGKIFGSDADKVASAIDAHPGGKALLQLHADRGMNAARQLLDANALSPNATAEQVSQALASNPAAKAAYENDPAFRAGFDSLMWAKGHDPAAYAATSKALDERDVRYQQHNVRVSA